VTALCGKSLASYPDDVATIDTNGDDIPAGKTCETCLRISRSHPEISEQGYVQPRESWSFHIARKSS
jgi:hypothetical protein